MSEEKNVPQPASTSPTEAPAAATGPQPVKKKRKGIKTLVAGVVCLVLAGVSLAVSIAGGTSLASNVTSNKGQLVTVPGKLQVTPGDLYVVSLPSDQANSGATCTATGDGVETSSVAHQGNLESDRSGVFTPEGTDQKYSPVLTLTGVSPQADGVKLDCGSATQVFVSDPINAAAGGGMIIAGFAGMFFFGLAGFILVVVGLVRLVRSNKRA
ncbi:hypothetical protein KRX56_01175 [Dermabacteraceae bacterium TAE3-ERU27]|nr:hypothetical protein [Dermabacteraceae bacterium TAE3-ERU27]